MDLTLVLLATLTGMLTGAVFNAAGVPIPAPPNFAGVMGVVGVFLGYRLIEWVSAVAF
jgi:XapX domain-containing protein